MGPRSPNLARPTPPGSIVAVLALVWFVRGLEIAERHAAGAAEILDRETKILHQPVDERHLGPVLHRRVHDAIGHVAAAAAAPAPAAFGGLGRAVETGKPVDLEDLDRLD